MLSNLIAHTFQFEFIKNIFTITMWLFPFVFVSGGQSSSEVFHQAGKVKFAGTRSHAKLGCVRWQRNFHLFTVPFSLEILCLV